MTEWDVPPAVTCLLVLTALLYAVGWVRIRRTRPSLFPVWRLCCFLGGILSLFVAVASPLDTLSGSLLFMHMGQHFVLMSVAPPLIVVGAPVVPLLRGLPRWTVHSFLGPTLISSPVHRLGRLLVDPRTAFILMNLAYVGWHIPIAYELALGSESWHNVEHTCFFFTSVLFWWPVLEPWPYRRSGSRWTILLYLSLADIVNTGLSAFLCFSGRVIYPSYQSVPRPLNLSALNDQIAAGALMWVCGSAVFLIPAIAIVMKILAPGKFPSARSAENQVEWPSAAERGMV